MGILRAVLLVVVLVAVLDVCLGATQVRSNRKPNQNPQKRMSYQWYCYDDMYMTNPVQYCDGNQECMTGEDEMYCDTYDMYSTSMPSTGSYICWDGYTPAAYCDNIWECPDGDDEMYCHDDSTTADYTWQSTCFDDMYGGYVTYCDGMPECSDSSDEMWCMNMCMDYDYYTNTYQGFCDDGLTCSYWCDGISECPNGEDEAWCGDMNNDWNYDMNNCGYDYVEINGVCTYIDSICSSNGTSSPDMCPDSYFCYDYNMMYRNVKKNLQTRTLKKTPTNRHLQKKSLNFALRRLKNRKAQEKKKRELANKRRQLQARKLSMNGKRNMLNSQRRVSNQQAQAPTKKESNLRKFLEALAKKEHGKRIIK